LAMAVGTLLLCIPAVKGFGQNFSRGIAANYRIAADVTYMKSGAWEGKMDIYARRGAGPQPALIWIHGGSMPEGTKDGQLFSRTTLQVGFNICPIPWKSRECLRPW
jgi:acetyl esterase/lipase